MVTCVAAVQESSSCPAPSSHSHLHRSCKSPASTVPSQAAVLPRALVSSSSNPPPHLLRRGLSSWALGFTSSSWGPSFLKACKQGLNVLAPPRGYRWTSPCPLPPRPHPPCPPPSPSPQTLGPSAVSWEPLPSSSLAPSHSEGKDRCICFTIEHIPSLSRRDCASGHCLLR